MNKTINYSAICAKIFMHFGEDMQRRKLQEECAELIRAIARKDEENMLEEMADVQLLIDQFKTSPEYLNNIVDIMQKKVERTLDKIKKDTQPCLAIDCLGCTCTNEECRMNAS